uniref:Uncharacterized protein n=1 Tax=Crocodylus porosus TaxID=8502 RepID=A0A7M4FE64_CROPO
MRSWCRSPTRSGAIPTSTTRSVAGSSWPPASAASCPPPAWRNTCSSECWGRAGRSCSVGCRVPAPGRALRLALCRRPGSGAVLCPQGDSRRLAGLVRHHEGRGPVGRAAAPRLPQAEVVFPHCLRGAGAEPGGPLGVAPLPLGLGRHQLGSEARRFRDPATSGVALWGLPPMH